VIRGVETREWKSSLNPSRLGGRGRGDEVEVREIVRRWWIVPVVYDSEGAEEVES
jgi:hypothetical protein